MLSLLSSCELLMVAQSDDQIGFSLAFSAYQKAKRAELLLAMGDFDDEG